MTDAFIWLFIGLLLLFACATYTALRAPTFQRVVGDANILVTVNEGRSGTERRTKEALTMIVGGMWSRCIEYPGGGYAWSPCRRNLQRRRT